MSNPYHVGHAVKITDTIPGYVENNFAGLLCNGELAVIREVITKHARGTLGPGLVIESTHGRRAFCPAKADDPDKPYRFVELA